MGSRRESLTVGAVPLAELIARAETVFPELPLTDLAVCTCAHCVPAEVQRVAARLPRRDLDDALLRDWIDAADPSDAETEAVRRVVAHLLPRLLDRIARDGAGGPVEPVLRRGQTGDRRVWTGAQGALLDAFATSWIDGFADAAPRRVRLDDALCTLAGAGFALAPVLNRIADWPAPALIARLHQDWTERPDRPALWRSPFWQGPCLDAAQAQVDAWYAGDALHAALVRAWTVAAPGTADWDRVNAVDAVLAGR